MKILFVSIISIFVLNANNNTVYGQPIAEQISKVQGQILEYERIPGLEGLLQKTEISKMKPNRPIFIKITDKKKNRYSVEIDTVQNYTFDPSALLAPFEEVQLKAMHTPKQSQGPYVSYFYLGKFGEGKRITYLITSVDADQMLKTVVTQSDTLDVEFLKDTLKKTGNRIEKVDLKELLAQGKAVSGEFRTRYKSEKMTTVSIKYGEDMPERSLKREYLSVIKWEKYDDILDIYNKPKKVNNRPLSVKDENLSLAQSTKWNTLGKYEVEIPKFYRFRLRSGFSFGNISKFDFDIRTRPVLPSDTSDAFSSGFPRNRFNIDSTKAVTISGVKNSIRDVKPVLFLQVYPFNKKNLEDEFSFFASIKKVKWPKGWAAFKTPLLTKAFWKSGFDYLTHSASFVFGTPIIEDAFDQYYLGLSFEVVQGIDISIAGVTYEFTEFTITEPFKNGISYYTNDDPVSIDSFAKKVERNWDWSFALNVDATIFQKGFGIALNSIKKSIIGN